MFMWCLGYPELSTWRLMGLDLVATHHWADIQSKRRSGLHND